jgi:hypothetical protein
MSLPPRCRTGLNALKAKVKIRGLSAIDVRTVAGRELVAWRRELLEALGGVDVVSPQRRAIVDVIVRTKLYIDSLDAWLVEQPSLILKKRRAVLPVLKERQQLADSLTRQLTQVGLERRAKAVGTLADRLAEVQARHDRDDVLAVLTRENGSGDVQATSDEAEPPDASEALPEAEEPLPEEPTE